MTAISVLFCSSTVQDLLRSFAFAMGCSTVPDWASRALFPYRPHPIVSSAASFGGFRRLIRWLRLLLRQILPSLFARPLINLA
jgi:hypothetical protein